MSFQSERYGHFILRKAQSADNGDIREIFESASFSGGLDVQFLRGAEPISSFEADGDRAEILVAEDALSARVIAVGGAVVRTEFLGGKPEKCAYLTGLKVRRDYRGKLSFIPRAYRVICDMVSDCAAIYTTILDSNTAVIKMLEKKHRNMPEYRYIGHYTTFCLGRGKPVIKTETDDITGFGILLERHFSRRTLSPCSPEYKGFGNKHFYCVRDNRGEIAACCFIGDQSATKYYKMCSYGGIYKAVSHLPTTLFGYPPFPKPGEIIQSGVISYLYIRGNDRKLCSDFLRSASFASGYSMLLWGVPDDDPLCDAVRNMRSVRYGSRIYEVVRDSGGSSRISGPIGMEAALL